MCFVIIYFFSDIFLFFRLIWVSEIYNISFYWRIIALQCCVGFCHTTTWISHKYVYVPSFFVSLLCPQPPSHPSRSSQSTKLIFLCSAAASHWVSMLHIVLYIHQRYSLNFSHPFLSLVHQFFVCKYIFISHLFLYLKFCKIFMNLLLSVIIRTLMVANIIYVKLFLLIHFLDSSFLM